MGADRPARFAPVRPGCPVMPSSRGVLREVCAVRHLFPSVHLFDHGIDLLAGAAQRIGSQQQVERRIVDLLCRPWRRTRGIFAKAAKLIRRSPQPKIRTKKGTEDDKDDNYG